ncbi:type I-E CRISPR-associated protein Cse2/CasB [Streptomyces sp. GSL17-111]|uniref:type I-E CRISPR-associated protein Cse2/CasB n=1 Tax=Streptomyces sp. GSL17-111 TaxID=3121596 RepID=UPI0030F39B07
MTTVTAPASLPVRRRVAELTGRRVSALQRGYLADEPKAVAAVARLRRGAGRAAGDVPDLWDLVDTGPLHDTDDGARPLRESELARAEGAVHVALTLWAVHQQSRSTGMHRRDTREARRGLGAAIRSTMQHGEIDEPLRKRLVRAGTAPDLTSLAQRLRDIVTLLRTHGAELDYALLAGQLYAWQWHGGPATVRAEWGRSFHAWRGDPTPDGQRPADTPDAP